MGYKIKNMNISEGQQAYYQAVHDVSRERANQIVNLLLENKFTAEQIVFKVITPTLDQLVQDFMDKKVILSQHFVATKISDEIIERLLPMFAQKNTTNVTCVIGCASGDFHGLGKKIVMGSLRANMIKCIDLGLNVSAEKYVDAAIENNASIIGISSMMVHTATGDNGPRKVRTLLQEKNLFSKIKLIVGGAPYRFDDDLFKTVGADDFALNGIEAVEKIINLHNKTTEQ